MSGRLAAGGAAEITLCLIDALGLCSELSLESEGPRAPGELGHLAAGVGEIAEDDGPGRARLRAGGDVFPWLDLAMFSQGPFARLLEAMVAEGGFFHHNLFAHPKSRV